MPLIATEWCELSYSADPQLWSSSSNPSARVSTAYSTTPKTTLRDGGWHHLAAVYDGARRTASLYVDGQRLVGTFASSTGLAFTPAFTPPQSFAFGHSPWTSADVHTDVTLRDLRVWGGALLPEQVTAEVAAFGVSSPPPPAPSPPHFDSAQDGAQVAPLSPTDALETARAASVGLISSLEMFTALLLRGRLAGEPPLVLATPKLHVMALRATVASLRATNLTLPLSYAPTTPLHVALPPRLQLRDAASGALVPEDTLVDVALVAWGMEMHGWRPGWRLGIGTLSDGPIASTLLNASTLSNVSMLSVRAVADGARLSLHTTDDEPISVSIPVAEAPWPLGSAAEGARMHSLQEDEELLARARHSAALLRLSGGASSWASSSSTAVGSNGTTILSVAVGTGTTTTSVAAEPECYGAPLNTCNERGACVYGHCVCEVGYVGANCTQRLSCAQWRQGAYSADGCKVLSRGQGAVVCSCTRTSPRASRGLPPDDLPCMQVLTTAPALPHRYAPRFELGGPAHRRGGAVVSGGVCRHSRAHV